ncbi:protein MIZU-KUSSEI 1-like [Impatiens glandulifera]|uniref:protein MIZU-KUSSEI 1-like n=1 Tax=Impatiens glandulifera TaxID=253017 RepID=UPI001FB0605B|nr:protein MIZU-KUSSEI 1-like [Impatiens glandulifera]
MIFNMPHEQLTSLPRTSSCSSTKRLIIPSTYNSNNNHRSVPLLPESDRRNHPSSSSPATFRRLFSSSSVIFSIFKSIVNLVVPTTCRWLTIPTVTPTISLGRKVTGTLFGNRRGHVSFAVQLDPRSEPVFVIELAITTSGLVKEMSSGLVRIALESEKGRNYSSGNGSTRPGKLFGEPVWTMYCNGKKCGYATTRMFTESDWHVLSMVKSVSVGAGVIPVVDDGRKGNGSASEGELLYMRAKFERVVGSRDSEAFYMLNPDGNGGPELSIFLLRI